MSAPTTPTRRIDVSAGTEQVVSVDQISKELSRLWGDITRQVEERSGQIPLRTSILTLVVVARGRTQVRMAHDTLHELVEQLPSRAIVVEIGRKGTPLQASVSGHCRYLGTGRAACYEVIELRAPEDRLIAVPSLLSPLELYDVPSFLWWVGAADFASPDFLRLADTAERIIVDSSRFDDALEALASYHRFLRGSDTACTGADLNWARTTSWRELIAQAFDNPMMLDLMPAIGSVTFSFDPSAEAQALLVVGWLASRLGWVLKGASRDMDTLTLWMWNRYGMEVTVALNRQASTGIGLRAVRIVAASNTASARLTVRRQSEDLVIVSTESPGMPRQDRVVRDRTPRLCDLIGQELVIHTRDRVFDDAHDVVASVVNALASGGRYRHDE